jgi:hypothetical protein
VGQVEVTNGTSDARARQRTVVDRAKLRELEREIDAREDKKRAAPVEQQLAEAQDKLRVANLDRKNPDKKQLKKELASLTAEVRSVVPSACSQTA